MRTLIFIASLLVLVVSACKQPAKPIPVYGQPIPAFSFMNQDGQMVSEKVMDGHISVVDFFFTTCPTICPRMQREMLRVHEAYQQDTSLVLLSHTIDPEYDSVAVLKAYRDRLGVSSSRWHFLTGDEAAIFEIAGKHYMVSAAEDPKAPGGHIHSGALILIDGQRRVRGFYDGTRPDQVDLLIADIRRLKEETHASAR